MHCFIFLDKVDALWHLIRIHKDTHALFANQVRKNSIQDFLHFIVNHLREKVKYLYAKILML